jgi:TPR repeat protein
MYANGVGVPQDYAKAFALYEASAVQGNPKAIFNLGLMYQIGHHVERDYHLAFDLCKKSAEMGYASAEFNLGLLYWNGTGCQQDYVEAVGWYLKAAKQGNITAQLNLGLAYEEGEGVEKNWQEAAYWFERAAEFGDFFAQESLGRIYSLGGNGLQKDLVLAYKWYRLSRKNNEGVLPISMANPCDAIIPHMTAEEISHADEMVSAWSPAGRKALLPIFQVQEKVRTAH